MNPSVSEEVYSSKNKNIIANLPSTPYEQDFYSNDQYTDH
jgi:hypothetical protein